MPRILFVLPAAGGSGGANSVVQECLGLAALGVGAAIAVDSANHAGFLAAYPELQPAGVAIRCYRSVGGLASLLRRTDVVVATLYTTLDDIRDARRRIGRAGHGLHVAYYVQDYEPLFHPPHSDEWRRARNSYTLIGDAMLFAKTDWLARIVEANHGVRVERVEPSIDHSLFHARGRTDEDARTRIVAMLRPSTMRRAPSRTIRILLRLAEAYGNRVELAVFGQSDFDLAARGYDLPPGIANRGHLKRAALAGLMRSADIFLDLSDYQAFGRAALEAMACGTPALAPAFGGAGEFIADRQNGYLVDTRSDEAIASAVRAFMELPPEARATMREAAVATAARYTVEKAALSELKVFLAMMESHAWR